MDIIAYGCLHMIGTVFLQCNRITDRLCMVISGLRVGNFDTAMYTMWQMYTVRIACIRAGGGTWGCWQMNYLMQVKYIRNVHTSCIRPQLHPARIID